MKCMRCVCVWLGRRGWRGGGERIGFGLYQSCENRGGVLDVCLGYGGVGGEWSWGLDQGLEVWVVLCLCEM